MTDREALLGDSLTIDELSVTEVAEMTGMHTATVRVWIQEHKLPSARKDGRKWMVRRDDVQRLLREEPKLGTPHKTKLRQRRDLAAGTGSEMIDAGEPIGPRQVGLIEGGLI